MRMVQFTEFGSKESLLFNPEHIVAIVEKPEACVIYTTGAKSSAAVGANFRVIENIPTIMAALSAAKSGD